MPPERVISDFHFHFEPNSLPPIDEVEPFGDSFPAWITLDLEAESGLPLAEAPGGESALLPVATFSLPRHNTKTSLEQAHLISTNSGLGIPELEVSRT
jgi:hypothetical protein